MMARRGDTKPLCHVAHASVALLRVSIAHSSRDKSLVLCHGGMGQTYKRDRMYGGPRSSGYKYSGGEPVALV